ncbi:hypothetical protein P5V15_011514 [Pogonomyrmex californicus]
MHKSIQTYQSGAIGTINNLGKFDADFFGFSVEQAHACDPMLRMLLEHSYEAVIDAGINPKQLRGKNTAVIIGVAFNETQKKLLYQDLQIEKIIDKYITFDNAANGYSRSEIVAALYLQKAKNAKRIYATCPHIKINSDVYKEEGITFPSTLVQSTLLMELYNECGIPTSCLDYIEAHETGTRAGDPAEINAINNVLCKNRENPLMIGSVKSNLGHAEPASGFSQIAKV